MRPEEDMGGNSRARWHACVAAGRFGRAGKSAWKRSMEKLRVLVWPGLGLKEGVEHGKRPRSENGEFLGILCSWRALAGQKRGISR